MLGLFRKKIKGETITLTIEGMHCTSCAMNIDGALEETEGVFEATTNYAKSSVEVNYDPEKVRIEDLVKAVEKTGYKIA